MMKVRTAVSVIALTCVVGDGPAFAAGTIGLELVASGLTSPNLTISAGDGSGRLFVVDQIGQVRIIDAGGNLLATPFLDVSANMVTLGAFGPGSFDERGLLGLAFHPDFAINDKFYVYYSAPLPGPDPITFELADTIPDDVTFTGGIIGTQLSPPLYCSGMRAFEVSANQSAKVEFDQPVIKVRFFFVHKVGAGAGTVTAVLDDGSTLGPVTSNQATAACDAANFVTFEDLNFPVIGIKRLDLQAGTGAGLVLFLDDLEITRFNHRSRISEFTVSAGDPDVADPNSERIILEIDEPQFNHNSGTLAFGPDDGFLYISVGDGGNGNDVGPFHNAAIGNGQDTSTLLGSILRIDLENMDPGLQYAIPPGNPFVGAAGRDEIWAFGLRNPFRFSFDSGGAHRLFCGDAGQDLFEEVSIVGKGDNMGWRIKEGLNCFDPNDPLNPPVACPAVGAGGEPLIDPIIEYPHFDGAAPIGQVVIGGFVYRGSEFPGLAGKYVFGDFSLPPFGGPADGSIFLGTEVGPGTWQRNQPIISTGPGGRLGRFVLGFGQDSSGEVYVGTTENLAPVGSTGAVFKIVTTLGDFDGDGDVDLDDFGSFAACFNGSARPPAAACPPGVDADLDGDGDVDLDDFGIFAANYTGSL